MESVAQDNEQEAPTIPYRECKQRILMQLVSMAKEERKRFLADGDEINKFFNNRDDAGDSSDTGKNLPQMSKSGQFVSVIGAYLYEQNPTRRAEPRSWSGPEANARAKAMEAYLNYVPRQTNLKVHCKRAITQACVYGKGVVWIGWDEDKNIVTAIFDTVQNHLVDPDARFREECNWKGRIRRKPRWWLEKRYPEAKKEIEAANPVGKRKSSKGVDYSTDTIEVYELYFKVGLHNYEGGEDLLEKSEDGETYGDDTPMKYVMTSDGHILHEGPWEVPLFRKQLWPCIELDFYEIPGQYYPKSPIKDGLSQLRNMNGHYRRMVARLRQAARGFIALLAQSGVSIDAEALDKVLDISPTPDGVFDVIRVNATGLMENARLEQIFQQFKLESNFAEFQAAIAFEEQEFAKATGLYNILFQGQPETQMRSAAEVQFRDRTSRSRIEDMQKSVETWSDEIASVQALYARFLGDPEDFAPILGPELAAAIGTLIPPIEDEAQRLASEMMTQGAPPKEAMQIGQMKAEEQDMMLRQQGGITFDEWLNEAEYTIAGGSTRRKDVDEEKEVYGEAANQLEPTLFKTGVPPLMMMALRIARQRFEVYGAPKDLLDTIDAAAEFVATMPLPYPTAPPPGGPQPGSGGPEAPPLEN
jgi:hypothetical protein